MDNIKIRLAKKEDALALLNIYKYYIEHTNITFEYDVPSIEEFEERIITILEKYPYIVAENKGKILGYAYANTFKARAAYDWTVEWSIYLDYHNISRGLGQKLYDSLVVILKQQGIVKIEACITYPNENSIKFHTKNGFSKVAHFNKVGYKFDKWHDVVWYEKNILDNIKHPTKVRWIKEIDIKM